MIHDKIERLGKYMDKADFEKIKMFLEQVNPDMEERRYEIDGVCIFANVESYDTKNPDDCRIEAHDKYIDIQAGITGAERIGVYRRHNLEEIDEYDSEKDVIHFNMETAVEVAHTTNSAGYFTLLFPEEAHSPKQKVEGCERVKKFVIKIMKERLI